MLLRHADPCGAMLSLLSHADPCRAMRCPLSPTQGFDKYGIGAFDAVPTPQLQAALGLKAGVVTSGNSLDFTAEDMERMVQHEAVVKVGAAS